MIYGGATSLTEREVAIRAARAADEKHAENVIVLDLAGLTVLTDYFVICSGTTNAQVRAIIDAVRKSLSEIGLHPLRQEGDHISRWALIDYGGVVIHVFHHVERDYYDLERLWENAPRVDWQAEIAAPAASPSGTSTVAATPPGPRGES